LPLADGSMIMLVVGHVTTPCGRVVQRQYRGITRRDYFRLARAERDTAGRPSCKTDGGRTVYGGGGIYPDVVLPEPDPAPLWLARAREDDLPLKWVGGYVAAAGASLPALDSLAAHPMLPAAAQETFRTFAAAQGVAIPAAAGDQLQRLLVRSVALAQWGGDGLYATGAAAWGRGPWVGEEGAGSGERGAGRSRKEPLPAPRSPVSARRAAKASVVYLVFRLS